MLYCSVQHAPRRTIATDFLISLFFSRKYVRSLPYAVRLENCRKSVRLMLKTYDLTGRQMLCTKYLDAARVFFTRRAVDAVSSTAVLLKEGGQLVRAVTACCLLPPVTHADANRLQHTRTEPVSLVRFVGACMDTRWCVRACTHTDRLAERQTRARIDTDIHAYRR